MRRGLLAQAVLWTLGIGIPPRMSPVGSPPIFPAGWSNGRVNPPAPEIAAIIGQAAYARGLPVKNIDKGCLSTCTRGHGFTSTEAPGVRIDGLS